MCIPVYFFWLAWFSVSTKMKSLNYVVTVTGAAKSALRLDANSPRASAVHSHRLRNQTASVSAVATCWTICFVTRSIPSEGIAVHHAGVWSWVMSCGPFVLDHRGATPQPPPTGKRLWPSAVPRLHPATRRLMKVPQGSVRNDCIIKLVSSSTWIRCSWWLLLFTCQGTLSNVLKSRQRVNAVLSFKQ